MTPVIETLTAFYEAMHSTVAVRRSIVTAVLHDEPVEESSVGVLRGVLDGLCALPVEEAGRPLQLADESVLHVDLSYEIDELVKDLVFIEEGEAALQRHLAAASTGFDSGVQELVAAVRGRRFSTLITDRDGTINNYCGRYASSVQSIYNAVFISRFVAARTGRGVILTSAPLDGIGLADLSVVPSSMVLLAGSKGREYLDADGTRRHQRIDPAEQQVLDELDTGLERLLAEPAWEAFTLIGSGRQTKVGQITVAYQDITRSVPASLSLRFAHEVKALVAAVDPEGSTLRIEDTGLDLELILTVGSAAEGTVRDFDKSDGVRFLDAELGLGLGRGSALVCGDTAADVVMMNAVRRMGSDTTCVFVSSDDQLRAEVAAAVPDVHFASTPDVLVSAFDRLSRA